MLIMIFGRDNDSLNIVHSMILFVLEINCRDIVLSFILKVLILLEIVRDLLYAHSRGPFFFFYPKNTIRLDIIVIIDSFIYS